MAKIYDTQVVALQKMREENYTSKCKSEEELLSICKDIETMLDSEHCGNRDYDRYYIMLTRSKSMCIGVIETRVKIEEELIKKIDEIKGDLSEY